MFVPVYNWGLEDGYFFLFYICYLLPFRIVFAFVCFIYLLQGNGNGK